MSDNKWAVSGPSFYDVYLVAYYNHFAGVPQPAREDSPNVEHNVARAIAVYDSLNRNPPCDRRAVWDRIVQRMTPMPNDSDDADAE